MSDTEVFLQQLITGFSNGMIIALIALGYTMVYGIIELINFAHGDLFMLGSFLALTIVGLIGSAAGGEFVASPFLFAMLFLGVPAFCAGLNLLVDCLAYKPLRKAPRLAPLVSAIGVSFIFLNFGLFWGGLPLAVFDMGRTAAAPKDFPNLVPYQNLLSGVFGNTTALEFTLKDLMVVSITVPLMLLLSFFVKRTQTGRAMRAVAQSPLAAQLMGINVEWIIGLTFVIGGALAGVASVVYALYNNTIFFQMGFRVGVDAFAAAVVGGIGNLPGAVLGGILIGIIRAASDQYIATSWTNVVVFSILVLVLIFRPAGLLGANTREKV